MAVSWGVGRAALLANLDLAPPSTELAVIPVIPVVVALLAGFAPALCGAPLVLLTTAPIGVCSAPVVWWRARALLRRVSAGPRR